MNSYISLTKTFIKSLSMSEGQDKHRKTAILILSIISIICIMLPSAILVGTFTGIITKALIPLNQETLIIQLFCYIIAIFTFIFGTTVILNELYFSNDIEYVLPLPIEHWKLVLSKFSATYIGENLMQILFSIACVIGFGIGRNINLISWIMAILGTFFLSILPMVYCSIITIILMRFTKILKNKDLVQKITVFLIFIIILLLLRATVLLKDFNLDNVINGITNMNNSGFKVLSTIFPTIYYYIKAINTGNILYFGLYLLLSAIAIVIMLFIAEAFYYKGVINLSTANFNNHHNTLAKVLTNSKEKNVALSYFIKEIKILRRTPTFYTHCILSNFIWPIFVLAIYQINNGSLSLDWLKTSYSESLTTKLFILCFIIGISSFVTSLNSISSNAISREGKHFQFMKLIPVKYKTQVLVKSSVGILFAFLGVMVFFIPFCLYINIPLIDIIIYILLGSLSITATSLSGIYIDSIQPKLVWDDELSVLRENYNVFFSMAISIAFIAIFSFGSYFALKNSYLNFYQSSILLLLIMFLCNLITYYTFDKNISKNISTQEEM